MRRKQGCISSPEVFADDTVNVPFDPIRKIPNGFYPAIPVTIVLLDRAFSSSSPRHANHWKILALLTAIPRFQK
jgi:hypothetical protein